MKHLFSNHNATTLGPLFDKRHCTCHPDDNPPKPCEQKYAYGDCVESRRLKEKGLKLVRENNENWMELCVSLLRSGFRYVDHAGHGGNDFTGEDIRFHCERIIGPPRHPNAWGALINTLIKRKIIVPTGEYRPMKDKTSHARSTPVYKS